MHTAEKILSELIPDDYYDRLLPFSVKDQRVKKVCEYYQFESSDLTNLKIAVAGSGAIIEVANLVMGALDQRKGTQHAEMSFSAVIERLEKQDTDIDHLRSAYMFLEQAEDYLSLNHIEELKEALGKVNTRATDALTSSGTNNVDDLVMASKLLILVDVFSQSFTREGDLKLVPINNLKSWKRQNMIVHVVGHLKRLVKILNKKGLPVDGLRKVLTLSYQSDDAEKIYETYDKCIMRTALKTEIVDEDTIKVTLPPLNLIPDAMEESFATLRFLGVNGTAKQAHALSLCIEEKQQDRFLNIGYFGVIYSLPLSKVDSEYGSSNFTEDDEMIDVTIKENIITDTSVKSKLELCRDMTDIAFEGRHDIWTPRDIRIVAPGAEYGDVTSVKSLALCYDNSRYTMRDIIEARKIMKVTKSLYLSGASLPDNMMDSYDIGDRSANIWYHLENSAADSEMEQFLFFGCFDDPEAIYEVEDADCDYAIGKLVMNAKKTGLMNIKFSKFSAFSQALVSCTCADNRTCEEIGFKWTSANNRQEEVQELIEKIGWKKKENPDPQYDVVIVKFRSDEWYWVWKIVLYGASQMSDTYSKIPEISTSGKASDISSNFWNTLMENPEEYITRRFPDEAKIREAYQNSARSYGVRLELEEKYDIKIGF